MAAGLRRDTKENIRLAKIANLFSYLKDLRQLCKENREHLVFLMEFREVPIYQLEELEVDRLTSEAVFVLDGLITPDFLESFRKTESKRFWE